MKKPNIVCDEQIPYARETFSRIGRLCLLPAQEIRSGSIGYADALVIRSVTIVKPELLSGTSIEVVGSVTSGIDHIDTSYLNKSGIKLISAAGSNANSVAEYVIAALLVLSAKKGIKLKGMKVGIVGVGHVGSRVDKKCRALGMKTIWNDPPLARWNRDPKFRSMREIFSSDIITLHVPLTFRGQDATYHLADDKLLRGMKKSCIFINTARGKVVNERALVKYGRKGLFQGMILDVWYDEPDIDCEILSMADIATPHIAGYSMDGKVTAVDMIFKGLCRYYKIRDDWSVRDMLRPPADPMLNISETKGEGENVVKKAVLAVYDPRRDDQKLRKIIGLSPKKRREYFERLRQRYPVRREFDNYRVDLPYDGDKIQKILKKLGFGC